jgi:NitT/TauT family transport system substrate-binding protein
MDRKGYINPIFTTLLPFEMVNMTDKPVIRIGHLPITDHLILGVTMDKLAKGSEKFNDAQIEAKSYRGWNSLADDLRKGDLDAACILAPLAMEFFHAGVPIRLLLQTHKSGSTLIKNKRANIENLEDFKGRSILIPHYLSVHHLLFDKLMRDNGLEVGAGKDVIFDVCAPSDIPEILEWDEKGVVGGFIVAEPFGTQVVKAGWGEELAMSKEIWPNHPCCVLVAKEEVIQRHPDAIQELVNSLVTSGVFVTDNPAEASKIGASFLHQEESVIHSILSDPKQRVTMNELLPVIDDFELIQTYMTSKIEAMSAKIDLNKFINVDFALAAGAY